MVFRKMPACWFPTHAGAGIGAGSVISKRKEIDGNKWSYGGLKRHWPHPYPSPTGAGSRKMGSNCGYSIQLDTFFSTDTFITPLPLMPPGRLTCASLASHLCLLALSLVAFRTPIHAPCPCFRIFGRAKGIFLQRTFRRCCLIKCHFFLVSFTIVLIFLKKLLKCLEVIKYFCNFAPN